MMKAFECRLCGECCYGEGGIIVEPDELKRIADFLELTTDEFQNRFLEKKHNQLYAKTGPDNFCIFYDKKDACKIHPVKPRRCTLWPYYPAIVGDMDNWKLAQEACPGINPDCPFEEFVRQAREWNCSKGS